MRKTCVDESRAIKNLMALLAVEGISGNEQAVAEAIAAGLTAAGCRPEWMEIDDSHRRMKPEHTCGNLVLRIPGRRGSPRLLFAAHMDTVPICRGAEPVIRGQRITSRRKTGVGGDDRAGVAALLTALETIMQSPGDHPPLTIVFCAAEENGLNGSRTVRASDLANPLMGFNLDGGRPEEVVIGAIGASRWRAEVEGYSAHAGLAPEQGVSAALIASRAITEVERRGYFGRVEKPGGRGTSNVGTLHGGEARNQVLDRLEVSGECRSHSRAFRERLLQAYRGAFDRAARQVKNDSGRRGSVKFENISSYDSFRLSPKTPPARRAIAALRAEGRDARTIVADCGLDANNFNARGIPTVTLGTGAYRMHTVDEYVAIPDYLLLCRTLVRLISEHE